MMLKLLMLLFPFFLIDAAEENTPPQWVAPYEFPLEEIAVKNSQVSLQYLLLDTQKNILEKTSYYHTAVRILTQTGAEEFSKLTIDFNPAYYQVLMHAIRVCRNGIWSDRLESARSETLQRETNLESNLFSGHFSLVYFLEDIREGDILEYAYSEIGEEPLLSSHFADIIYLQHSFSIEKITYRLLAPPSYSFTIKPFNTDTKPQIQDLSPSVREWLWEAHNTAPDQIHLSDRPHWYNPKARVHISQFNSWKEVVQLFSELFSLPETVSPKIEKLVTDWKTLSSDPYEKALLALRFVQDNITYFGIEEAMGAVKPTDPSIVLERRSGDCKDKSFLLHTLLSLMDITSTPLLVNVHHGKQLPEILPSPFAFDHAILQIEIDGNLYWVDSTISLQGGSLKTNFCPNYEWGLALSPETENLTPFPNTLLEKPAEIFTSIVLESKNKASLKIKTFFHDGDADTMRHILASAGLSGIAEQRLSYMQEMYGTVSLESSFAEITDNKEENILLLNESYEIPTQKLKDKQVLEVLSFILHNYLPGNTSPLRSVPYAIPYPHWIKESIHIKNPFSEWVSLEEIYAQEHESLLYTLISKIEGNEAIFELELKHLKDHIPETSCQEYWNIIKDITWKSLPRMMIASH